MKIPKNWKAGRDLLKDRVILVTGAGNGIGAAVAKSYAAHGATVVLLDKHIRNLESVYDAIESSGGPQPALYPMNLEGAAEKDYDDLAATIDKEFGRLDGLLHNAAMLGALVPIAHYEADLWYRILQVNLNAPFLMTHACLPLLIQSPDSAILFNADSVGRHGKAYWGAYATSKAGIENFMQVLADETESNTGLRVNSIDPGPVATSLRALAYPGENPANIAGPEDVLPPFLYLISADSRKVTGCQFEL